MDKINNTVTSNGKLPEIQAKKRLGYSDKPLVIGLIFECDDRDDAYKIRLKSAIIYQIQQRLRRSDISVEFVDAKINAKYFRRIDPDHYDAQIWKRAEQELSRVSRFLQSKRANHIIVASKALIKYQSVIELLDVLPRESPNFANELSSFAVELYHNELNTLDKTSGERKPVNNCISLGLIGSESSVALFSDRLGKLTDFSEVRREYAGILVRWCVMPSNIRADFYNRLNRQDFDEDIKAHRRWLIDTLARLPRTYVKRNVKSKDISPAKIYGVVIADTKTEMLLLGLTKKQYCEAASQPGEIRRRLHNITRHTKTWPEREIGHGKVEIYGAADIFAKSVADVVCQKPQAMPAKPVRSRQVVTYQTENGWGRAIHAY